MGLTQKQRVLQHIMTRGTIDCKTAAVDYGIMALHSRVSELRREGWPIVKTYKSGTNRFGDKCHWYEYGLADD